MTVSAATGTPNLSNSSSTSTEPEPATERDPQFFYNLIKNYVAPETGDSGSEAAEFIKSGKRVAGFNRKMVYWAVVDHAHDVFGSHPSALQLRRLTLGLLEECKESFKDDINGRKLKETSGTIYRQIIVRNENKIRFAKLKATAPEDVRQRPSQHRATVKNLKRPDDVSEEDCEKLKNEMIDMYNKGPQHWVWPDIVQNMENTFYWRQVLLENLEKDSKERESQIENQEEDNNVDDDLITKSVDVLKRDYPFIFTLTGMTTHCRLLLTDQKDCNAALEAFLAQGDATITMKYLTSNSKQKFGCINLETEQELAILNSRHPMPAKSNKLLLLLHMLAVHFDEELDELIVLKRVR